MAITGSNQPTATQLTRELLLTRDLVLDAQEALTNGDQAKCAERLRVAMRRLDQALVEKINV
jgi:hypothetical protein